MKSFSRILLVLVACLLIFSNASNAHNIPSLRLLEVINKQLPKPIFPSAYSAVFTPDGKRLIWSHGTILAISDLRDSRIIKILLRNQETLYLTISSDGRYLAVVNNDDRKYPTILNVWDLRTYSLVKHISFDQMSEYGTGAIDFSPTGHTLALPLPRKTEGNDQYDIHLIDIPPWRDIGTLHSDDEMQPEALVWSADGKLVAATTGYGDAGITTLSVWSVKTKKQIYRIDDGAYNQGANDPELDGDAIGFIGHTHKLMCGIDLITPESKRHPFKKLKTGEDPERLRFECLFGTKRNWIINDRYIYNSTANGDLGYSYTNPYTILDPLNNRVIGKLNGPSPHGQILAVSPNSKMLAIQNSYGSISIYLAPVPNLK